MSPAQVTEAPSVSLVVPARAEYVLLARLALSAVCRLTPLRSEDTADLKLAITEAAAMRTAPEGAESPDGVPLEFDFRLESDRLVVGVTGGAENASPDADQELSRSIVEATVDECDFGGDGVRLVKRLDSVDDGS